MTEEIEVMIKAKVKRGQIKAFINHITNEMEICKSTCNEITEASVDYRHFV